ncbi:MAG: Gas vesicle synthesis GvpLGvpF [Gemmatimonadetes bacterium]|nr:Gas vesicle synthesis GvpLGvpF [Gemmatimonadota bacterium]
MWYVYGIVPADLPLAGVPNGLDDAGVALEPCDGVAALVSVLDGAQYAPAVMEANSGDVDWLSPRAVTHDLVLTWASDQTKGAVVPLPMFSLFSGRDALQAMLRDRSEQLGSALASVAEGREYALRVYRVEAELLGAVTSLSARLDEMAKSAAAASPGQRYLLERKLEAEKKTEARAVSQRIVDEIVTTLAPHALRHVRSPIPRVSDADASITGTMVLNAAFLVAPTAMDDFQKTLTSLLAAHGAHGFRFDFTGPWPPYHFVSEAARGT